MNIKPQESLVTCPCMRVFDTGRAITKEGTDLGPLAGELARRQIKKYIEELVAALSDTAVRLVESHPHPWCMAGMAQVHARVFGRLLAACTVAIPPASAKGSTLNGSMSEDMWAELAEVARREFDESFVIIRNVEEGRPNG